MELAQATGVIHGRFGCGVDEAEQLLMETAQGARMDLAALVERLLEPRTRKAALAAVAVVVRSRTAATD